MPTRNVRAWCMVAITSALAIMPGCGGREGSSEIHETELAGQPATPPAQPQHRDAQAEGDSAVCFQRVAEPRENAFTVLVPMGWQTEGGIVRTDPTAGGGAGNAIAAKLDFAIKRDAAGSVMMRWLPDTLFIDVRGMPAGQMGLFPAGSNYNGMTVSPVVDPATFLLRVALPYAHPQARGVQVVDRRSLPSLAKQHFERTRTFATTFTYDAASLTVEYSEGSSRYREKLLAVIENWGAMGAGMWGNKDTMCIRAPTGELERWDRLFAAIHSSVQINRDWLLGEVRGQMERAGIALRTQAEVQALDRQIIRGHQQTVAEIHNDMFLTLTDQEEYINPHTKEIEIGSNQWKHRWVTPSGIVAYSNDSYYNPNHDPQFNRSDFERTPVRPR